MAIIKYLRSSEAVSIEWADIDWEAKALHIPAERMKGGKTTAQYTAFFSGLECVRPNAPLYRKS